MARFIGVHKMNTIIPLFLAPAVSAIAGAMEKTDAIPYQAKSKASITAALLGISLALRLGIAAYQGELATLDVRDDAHMFLEALVAAFASAGGYAIAKSDKPVI